MMNNGINLDDIPKLVGNMGNQFREQLKYTEAKLDKTLEISGAPSLKAFKEGSYSNMLEFKTALAVQIGENIHLKNIPVGNVPCIVAMFGAIQAIHSSRDFFDSLSTLANTYEGWRNIQLASFMFMKTSSINTPVAMVAYIVEVIAVGREEQIALLQDENATLTQEGFTPFLAEGIRFRNTKDVRSSARETKTEMKRLEQQVLKLTVQLENPILPSPRNKTVPSPRKSGPSNTSGNGRAFFGAPPPQQQHGSVYPWWSLFPTVVSLATRPSCCCRLYPYW